MLQTDKPESKDKIQLDREQILECTKRLLGKEGDKVNFKTEEISDQVINLALKNLLN